MNQAVADFRRYQALGFSVRESIAFARSRRRIRQMLNRYDERHQLVAFPLGAETTRAASNELRS